MTSNQDFVTVLDLLIGKISPQEIARKIESSNLYWWDELKGNVIANDDQKNKLLNALRNHVQITSKNYYQLDANEEYYLAFWDDPITCKEEFTRARFNNNYSPRRKRKELQVDHICEVIKKLQFNKQEIPTGGKQKIKAECLQQRKLFSSVSVFNKAWQSGVEDGLFRMLRHENYAKGK